MPAAENRLFRRGGHAYYVIRIAKNGNFKPFDGAVKVNLCMFFCKYV